MQKSRKKDVVVDDDEYNIGTELSEEALAIPEEKVTSSGKKKVKNGKKCTASFGLLGEDDDVEDRLDLTRGVSDQEDEGIGPFSGKGKKSKPGKDSRSVFSTASDTIGDGDDDERSEEDEEPVVAGNGKNSFSVALLDEEDEADTKVESETVEEDDDAPELIFAGKKKSSKKKKKGVVSMTEAEEAEPELGVNPEEADDKNSKKKERDVPETSKNKGKKKMGGHTIAQKDEDEIDKILAELGEASPAPALSEDNKSKKKKSGKKEDNIDIILVEIGEGQATFAPTPQEDKGQLGDDAVEKEEVVK
ncbi:hypothetical protein K7X08_022215 [Anisodus acutangulus]|uniref:Uncharacterized protein n=1 Tax=Anisodus acutangulus TaxID=402998 RepID=A0A9Q1QV33_9SOLA|nr:hypothetical protein K7X08_022215 [Anisodus acutangulus]